MVSGAEIVIHCQGVGDVLKKVHKTNPVAYDKLLKKQQEIIMNKLDAAVLTVEEVGELTEVFEDWPIPRDTKSTLVGAAAEALDDDITDGSGRERMQDFTQLLHYFKSEHWYILVCPTVVKGMKFNAILDAAIALGCFYPSEATYQAMAAYYIIASEGVDAGKRKSSEEEQRENNSSLKFLKKQFKQKRGTTKPTTRINTLPEPAALEIQYPAIYDKWFAGTNPIPCPWNPTDIDAVIQNIPMRCSNIGMQQHGDSSEASTLVRAVEFFA